MPFVETLKLLLRQAPSVLLYKNFACSFTTRRFIGLPTIIPICENLLCQYFQIVFLSLHNGSSLCGWAPSVWLLSFRRDHSIQLHWCPTILFFWPCFVRLLCCQERIFIEIFLMRLLISISILSPNYIQNTI